MMDKVKLLGMTSTHTKETVGEEQTLTDKKIQWQPFS